MNEPIDDILYQVAEEVLEKLAFILSFPEEGLQEIDYDSATAGEVDFSGTFSGSLSVIISAELLPELAGNMLGLDNPNETTLDQQYDALKELINVICGNLLPKIGPKDAMFHVGVPKIIPQAVNFNRNRTIKAVARLPLEQGQCDILLFLN